MSDLEPCPFCGSTNIKAVTGEYNIEGDMYYEYYVICLNCKAMADYGESLNDAVSKWNKRAVKHGAWMRCFDTLDCSECGYTVDCRDEFNYCPMCGAKMDKE